MAGPFEVANEVGRVALSFTAEEVAAELLDCVGSACEFVLAG